MVTASHTVRRSRWLLAACLLFVPATALALAPPHDVSNGISCNACHAAHGGGMGGSFVPRGAEQEALCKSCHNPTGQAGAMHDVASHVVDGGTQIVDCGSCHDAHGPRTTTDPHPGGQTRPNLKLIRGNMQKYMGDTALEPALFQAQPDHFAFGGSNPPWNGVCQSCHTGTDHHRNDATADHDHQLGLACTMCHPHGAGFLPQGGCTTCHAEPQGSRRQIVEHDGDGGGDFARSSHHVQGTVADDDCTACHYVGDHRSGTVKLKDPDQGESQVFSFSPADPAALTPFCLHCHDGDGAQAAGGTEPFGDGRTVPDIDQAGRWAASVHAASGHSCLGATGCHGNGHGSNLRKLLQPEDGAPGPDNANEEEGFCYGCHGPGGVLNEAISNGWLGGTYEDFGSSVQAAFSLYSAHPVADSAPGHVFDAGNGPRELECTSCHAVHWITGKYWEAPAGYTPVALYPTGAVWGDDAAEKLDRFDPLRLYQPPSIGGAGLDLSGEPLPVDAQGASLLTAAVSPDYDSLCLACHATALGGATAIDWAQKKHGSAAAEPLGPAGWPLASPFDGGARGQYFLSCLDCHDPHGSENQLLIRRSANGVAVPSILGSDSTNEWGGLCDQCHASDPSGRHHNADVYAKVGTGTPCSLCHPFHHGSIYARCVDAGCHSHADFF